jgi:hypothetical protein
MSPRRILTRLTASASPSIGEPRPARPERRDGPEGPALVTSPTQASRRAARDRLVDACIESYVEWREECVHLEGAYHRWAGSGGPDRDLAFPAFRAALDREEKAALVYEFMIERVARRTSR